MNKIQEQFPPLGKVLEQKELKELVLRVERITRHKISGVYLRALTEKSAFEFPTDPKDATIENVLPIYDSITSEDTMATLIQKTGRSHKINV